MLAVHVKKFIRNTGCSKDSPPPQKPLPAGYILPLQKTIPKFVTFVGKSESTLSVDIVARTKGYLEKALFIDGTRVKKGQKLFVIEYVTNQAKYDGSIAALKKAKADLGLAKLNYERYRKLYEEGAVSQEDYDEYRLKYEQAVANKEEAENNKIEARQELSYNFVNAPFSGQIGRRLYDVGNLVGAPGDTKLTTLVKMDPMYIYFYPPSSQLQEVLDAQSGKAPLSVIFDLAGATSLEYTGKLDFINNQVQQGNDTMQMRALVNNPDKTLYPGQFGQLQLIIGEYKDAILIPQSLVNSDIEGKYTFLINDKDELSKQYIEISTTYKTNFVVTKGLSSSDRVLTSHLMILRPGMKVKPVDMHKKAARSSTSSGSNTALHTASNNTKSTYESSQ